MLYEYILLVTLSTIKDKNRERNNDKKKRYGGFKYCSTNERIIKLIAPWIKKKYPEISPRATIILQLKIFSPKEPFGITVTIPKDAIIIIIANPVYCK